MNLNEIKASGLEIRFPGAAKKKKTLTVKRAHPEEDLHRACMTYASLIEPQHPIVAYLFHSPNGGGRSKAESGALKAMGVKSGVPDLLLPFPSDSFKGLAVELKAGKNKLSAEQRVWLQTAYRNRWLVAVVRSIDEFKLVMDSYLNKKNAILDNKDLPGWTEVFQ